MTIADGRIDNFVNGDDLDIERTITSIPSGVLIESAWFMVKRNYNDDDSKAIISKLATHSNTANQGWIVNDGNGEATVRFYLTPADTELLYAYSEYPYSIKTKLDNDRINTSEIGTIVAYPWVKQGVT